MCYFDFAFKHPQESIDAICHALGDPKFGKIDLIVGTGISGTVLLIPVSLKSGIPCGVVRKPKDWQGYSEGGSHSNRKIETSFYMNSVRRYVIIDDFIDSGETIDRIIEAMNKLTDNADCAGVILYEGQDYHQYKDLPIATLRSDIKQLVSDD